MVTFFSILLQNVKAVFLIVIGYEQQPPPEIIRNDTPDNNQRSLIRLSVACPNFFIPLFVLTQKVEQKNQGKSKCSAAFAGLTHKLHHYGTQNF